MNFDQMYKNMLAHTNTDPTRRPEIRASSMPFCPFRFLCAYSEAVESGMKWSFMSEFYTKVGTAIHEASQKWFPLANKNVLFGNWQCYKCKNVKKLSTGPQICGCGSPMFYKELDLEFIDCIMSGHCDGLLLDLLAEDKYGIPAWVMELKSIGKNLKYLKAPYLGAQLQAKIYVSAIRRILPKRHKLHNINVKGYIIKYINREDPKYCSPDFIEEFSDDTLYNYTCKLVKSFTKGVLTKNQDLIFNVRPCEAMPDVYKECKDGSLCINMKDMKAIYKRVHKRLYNDIFVKGATIFAGDGHED